MKKRALISVYDKTGIVDFARGLSALGWEIVSTGGTEQVLKEAGLSLLSVEEVTQFPEMLAGRVKSLHPAIHAGILNRRQVEADQQDMANHDFKSIDMVVNNLYPFEETVKDESASQAEIIEEIDIGGPAMIRAAAKNYKDVIIVTDVSDYDAVLHDLERDNLTEDKRLQLAAKAFSLTAFYDGLIAQHFNHLAGDDFPKHWVQSYRFDSDLSYGENPHQTAAFYQQPLHNEASFRQLHGKALSYNNYNDIDASVDLLREFDQPACVAVKHTNPCGVAVADTIEEAYDKAYATDTTSIFGGIVALNREVTEDVAKKMSEIFLEVIIAPSFSKKALTLLTQKKNIRLIELPQASQPHQHVMEARSSLDGLLVQEKDLADVAKEDFQNRTQRPVSEQELADLAFANRVAKHVHSNGMVLAKDGATLALGHGEVRRVWALENALNRSEQDIEGAVVASDGFFFEDSIELMAKYGIQAIVQPGGSIHDEAVFALADEYGLSVLTTGRRHFKH